MSRRQNRIRRRERQLHGPFNNSGGNELGSGVRCRSCGREIRHGHNYFSDLDGRGGIFCSRFCFNNGGFGGDTVATHFKRSFELVGGSHDKFYTVEVIGPHFLVTYGRNGTNGKTQHTDMGTHAAAQAEADKKIREKTDKGYVPASGKPGAAASMINSLSGGGGSASTPAPTPPPPSTQPGTRYLDLDE